MLPVLLLSLLAACQAPREAPTSSAKGCVVSQEAQLPVRFDGGHILVPGGLNHHAVLLIVDTGAEASLVTPEAAVQYGLEHDQYRRTTLSGIGGQVTMLNARVTSFAVGSMEMVDQSMAVGSVPNNVSTDPPIGGLIGADFLASFEVEFDLPRRQIILYRTQNCGDDFAPWNGAGTAVPVRRLYKDLLSLDVMVDGQPMATLFDSGARASVLRTGAAERVGVDGTTMAHDPATHGRGVDRNDVSGHLHRFNEMRIGTDVLQGVSLDVAPLAFHNVDMLLGIDYLRSRHIWVSYATRRIFLAPPNL